MEEQPGGFFPFKTPLKSYLNWDWSPMASLSPDQATMYNPLQTNRNNNNNPLDPSPQYAVSSDNLIIAKALKRNFLLFSFFYSMIHAAVDCVIAFSAAELGTLLGSYGGFTLYIFYTLSSLFCAKPALQYFRSSKMLVLLGLIGMFLYVIAFFFAILWRVWSYEVFLIGAAVGGLGGGLLWTAQGVYYTVNAKLFSFYSNRDRLKTVYKFAAIFAMFYLALEACMQLISTAIFYIYQQSTNGGGNDDGESNKSWRPIVFGSYTGLAAISLALFWLLIIDFRDEESDEQRSEEIGREDQSHHMRQSEIDELMDEEYDAIYFRSSHFSHPHRNSSEDSHSRAGDPQQAPQRSISSSSSHSNVHNQHKPISAPSSSPSEHIFAVSKALFTVRKLQLLLPYQICFGLSAGLVQTYVNGVIVKDYIGDGYIGLLAGTVTLTAVIIAQPMAFISNSFPLGNRAIMILGGICFGCGGVFLLCFSDHFLSRWEMIILYYILHGIARGIWENTNKGIVSEFFSGAHERDVSFAAIYFASGLSGASGFILFPFLSRFSMALINVVVAVIAVICYLLAQHLHDDATKQDTLDHIHHLTDASSRSDSSDSIGGV